MTVEEAYLLGLAFWLLFAIVCAIQGARAYIEWRETRPGDGVSKEE